MRKTYVWHRGKMVPKDSIVSRETKPSYQVMRAMEAFQSPIDGKVINSRQDLAEHNRRHGVIDIGNDKSLFKPRPKQVIEGLGEEIKRAMGVE